MIDELGDPLDPHGPQLGRPRPGTARRARGRRQAAGRDGLARRPRTGATAWSSPSATTAGGSTASGSAARPSPRGWSARTRPRRLTDRQLVQYIWHPGLSTAETITDISGRGVGMDIVKSRIENLNGTVDVRSEPGQGTTFTIRLPLTLAIMPVLLVRICDEVYAIPLDHIDEIVEVGRRPGLPGPGPADDRDPRADHLAGRARRRLPLGRRLRRPRPATGTSRRRRARHGRRGRPERRDDGRPVVDELIGMQEVVLKSLEKNFRPVPGLSGASILGDGRVSLILDIDALIDMAARDARRPVGDFQSRARRHGGLIDAWTRPSTTTPRRRLRTIFERGAEEASQRPLEVARAARDPTDQRGRRGRPGRGRRAPRAGRDLVAACSMELVGRLTGQLLLVFEDDPAWRWPTCCCASPRHGDGLGRARAVGGHARRPTSSAAPI